MSTSQSTLLANSEASTPYNVLHENHGPAVAGTAIAMIVITTIAIAMRFASRILLVEPHSRSRLWWDDWTALVSWIFSTTLCALSIYWVHLGFGKQVTGNNTNQLRDMSKLSYAISFPYDLGIAFAKVSALFFYDRIFNHIRHFRKLLWLTGTIIIAWLITFEIVNIFMCSPIQKFWTPGMKGGHCLPERAVLLGNAIPNVVTDFIILTLPLPAVWNLRVDMKKRLGIFVAFILGYCVMTVSILRVVTVARFIPLNWFYPTSSYFYCQILLMIETPIALICICVPSTVPLFRIAMCRRASTTSSAFDPIAKYTYSLEPSTSNLPATAQATRQVGVLGNLISNDFDDRSVQLNSPGMNSPGANSPAMTEAGNAHKRHSSHHSSHHFGHDIGHHLSNITHTFSWNNLQQHITNESSHAAPSTQHQSLDNLFHPGGCQESYQAFTTNSNPRSSFSVPTEYKCNHSKKPNRKSEKVRHPHRPQSHHEESVDPETGLRWDEEIKVSTTVDIEYERRRSSQMLEKQSTMSPVSPISRDISPF